LNDLISSNNPTPKHIDFRAAFIIGCTYRLKIGAATVRNDNSLMNVLVDTPVWSLALRRGAPDLNVRERALTGASELIREGRVQMSGAIRQELLSGIREEEKFVTPRNYLGALDAPGIDIADYEEAAHMHNLCRARGIAGSAIDFLICAVAQRREWHIFTTDRDFERYRRVLGLRLFAVA
jgi:predicted nucleic acid-binding protein